MHPDYNSPAELKAFLDEKDMAMQKKFGQNFMINGAARQRIIDSLELEDNMSVWEVGPGLGCMTDIMLSRNADVTVFEIDRGFIACLKEFFEDYSKKNKFRIVEGDVLKNWKKEAEKSVPSRLFGNLPYNIAATFIAETITKGLVFDRCVFTVQKEVAMRMWAKRGDENYSSFTVLCQWLYDVKKGFELGPGNFWPKPNVASHSVILTKKIDSGLECDGAVFVKLVHTLFASRRKTIANNIKNILPYGVDSETFFEKAGIDKGLRAENLSVEDFVKLTRTYSELSGK